LAWFAVIAFSEAASRQECNILQPIENEESNLDIDYNSDNDIHIDTDQEMESPTSSDSEQNKKDDLTQSM